MLTRILALCVVLVATQFAVAEERSLVVRRTTHGAIVAAPQAAERSVVVASREVPETKSSEQNPPAPLAAEASSPIAKQRQRELVLVRTGIDELKRAGTNQQILVRIEMLEVSRTKLRKLGTDLPNAPGKSSNAKAVDTILNSLKENRVAKTLSRPNLVVMSGRPASFFVGGEIPIPTRDSKKAVEFQKFGTEVDLLATAIGKEQVRMDMRIKVSELDESHSIEINGTRVPGLTVRQCDTALSVACGETAMIECPGETRTETVKTSDGQRKDQENEIILLVALTPELVDPITPPGAEASVVPASQELAPASYVAAATNGQSNIQLHDLVTVLVEDIPTNASDTTVADKNAPRVHRMAAQVVDIRPNGVLTIEGKSEVCVGDEVWQHSITGNIRPQSLESDRTVRRQDIAEFRYRIRKTPIENSAGAPTGLANPEAVRSTSTASPATKKSAKMTSA